MIWSVLAACTSEEPDDVFEQVDLGPPTDTFPSFYGNVPKNVIFVSIDTTRRDLLARYGATAGDAYFLDELAQSGLALDGHRSCSNWTMPGMMCGVIGASNIDVGFVPDLSHPDLALLPSDTPTLASRLSAVGYRSILVTSNSWFSPDHGTDAGFDEVFRPDDKSTQGVFDAGAGAVSAAEESGVEKWYLHLHIKEPHVSYNPPDEYQEGEEDLPEIEWNLDVGDEHYDAGGEWPEMSDADRDALLAHMLLRYAGEVRYMNDQLSDAFEQYRRAGMFSDAMVVLFNDHGEEFWEHDKQTHAYGLHAEVNDGIGIVWATNIVSDEWSEPTVHQDLSATVLALQGVELDEAVTGLPIGTADPGRAMDFLAVARLGVIQSLVKDDKKLIYRWSTGEKWLYDLVEDPLEQSNIYDAESDDVIALWDHLTPKVEALEAIEQIGMFYTPNSPGP